MLTNNFYKLINRQPYMYLRGFSPSSSDQNNYPFVDIVNANGKIICSSRVEAADTDKYQYLGYIDELSTDATNQSYIIGANQSTYDYKQQVSSAGYTRTSVYDTTRIAATNDINTDTAATSRYPDGMGTLFMYIGNGTTQPTKNDYTMESCLTDYERTGLIVTSNQNSGIVQVLLTVKPTNDIQMSEIGIFTTPWSSTTYDRNTKAEFVMVCHDTFTPVTLPANKPVTITYTINLSELTAETTIG